MDQMLNILTNLTKAVIAVAVTPIAVVADIVMLPADAEDINRPAFSRTGGLLKAVGTAIDQAVKVEK